MNSIYKKTGFYALFTCITILFSALIQMPVYAAKPLEVKANNSFRISVTTPQTDTITLAGESEYMATPSSYTITITEIKSDYIMGHFDMILRGPISEKEFHLEGEVSSEIVPTNLHFGH